MRSDFFIDEHRIVKIASVQSRDGSWKYWAASEEPTPWRLKWFAKLETQFGNARGPTHRHWESGKSYTLPEVQRRLLLSFVDTPKLLACIDWTNASGWRVSDNGALEELTCKISPKGWRDFHDLITSRIRELRDPGSSFQESKRRLLYFETEDGDFEGFEITPNKIKISIGYDSSCSCTWGNSTTFYYDSGILTVANVEAGCN
ncbi:MAG: hypothetical protein AAF585_08050 [Verrucomicrobiota bacterium]